jgi:outer membrane receptor protein involved in Fe transport
MLYKDVLKTQFAGLGVSSSKKHQMKVPGQNFEGDYILSYYSPGDMTTEMFSVYGSFSKGIELIGGMVSLFPLYAHNRSSILRNGIMLPYTSDSYSLRGNINSKISSNCNLTYQVSYGFSKHQMEVNREYFSSGRLSESLKITYLPIKTLQVGYTFDHYYNELSSNSYRHFFFSDVSISYLPKNRWEFSCSVKNMFNKRYYSYFIENELTSFYRSYTIRPRNILLSATYRF